MSYIDKTNNNKSNLIKKIKISIITIRRKKAYKIFLLFYNHHFNY